MRGLHRHLGGHASAELLGEPLHHGLWAARHKCESAHLAGDSLQTHNQTLAGEEGWWWWEGLRMAPVGGGPARTSPAPPWPRSALALECCSPCSPTGSHHSSVYQPASWGVRRPSRPARGSLQGEVLQSRRSAGRDGHQKRIGLTSGLRESLHIKLRLVLLFFVFGHHSFSSGFAMHSSVLLSSAAPPGLDPVTRCSPLTSADLVKDSCCASGTGFLQMLTYIFKDGSVKVCFVLGGQWTRGKEETLSV